MKAPSYTAPHSHRRGPREVVNMVYTDQQDYNRYIRLFPNNLVAAMFGFTQKDYFEAEPGAETAPSIDLELEE